MITNASNGIYFALLSQTQTGREMLAQHGYHRLRWAGGREVLFGVYQLHFSTQPRLSDRGSQADVYRRDTPSSAPSTPAMRENVLEEKFLADLKQGASFPSPPNPRLHTFASVGLTSQQAWLLIEAMFATRICHNVSRRAALQGLVHYTIGPGGHEGVAGLGLALRGSDPALLHYRDTAFQLVRAMLAGEDYVLDLMRSYTVSAKDQATGGRHKALGSKKLNIIPTTSTIASHLPRVVGLASSLSMPRSLRTTGTFPDSSIVLGSAGDGSIAHAAYRSAVHFAQYCHVGMKIRCPAFLLVSDNDIAISTRPPAGWVEWSLKATQLSYFHAHGENVLDVYAQSQAAAELCRRKGSPVILHMTCARLFNHAGADAGSYYSPGDIRDIIARDPLPFLASQLLEQGLATHQQLLELYQSLTARAEEALAAAAKEPKLESFEAIASLIVPPPTASKPFPRVLAAGARAWQPPPKDKPLLYKQHITVRNCRQLPSLYK
eukprot:g8925.t1